MKKILFIFLLLFTFQNTNAQTWCPPGATWYYGYAVWQVAGYYKISYTGDTVINATNCKVLSKTRVQYNYPTGTQDTTHLNDEYTYADANKVYVYRLGNFHTLYDFSANVGDTITVAGYPINTGCDTLGKVKVDSIGTVVINSETLRFISVSPITNSAWGWHSRIVEKIGPIGYSLYYTYLFPTTQDYCGMMLDENGEGGNFRCYSDNAFGSYNISSSACDFTVSINEKINISEYNIYPNPATTTISIESLKYEVQRIKILDVLGQEIYYSQTFNNKTEIDVSQLPSGIYILQMQNNKGLVSKKFVKE